MDRGESSLVLPVPSGHFIWSLVDEVGKVDVLYVFVVRSPYFTLELHVLEGTASRKTNRVDDSRCKTGEKY